MMSDERALLTPRARNQLVMATRMMYPAVGASERGRRLRRKGSRMRSAATGGGLDMRVWLVV